MARKPGGKSVSKSKDIATRPYVKDAGTLYLLHQAYLNYRDLLAESSREFDQTPGAAMVLSLIERNEGVSATQIAKWLRVAPQSINIHIASLIEQDLIVREIDVANRRALKLSISPKGRSTLKRSRAAFAKAEAAVLMLLSETTRNQFRPILTELIETIQAHRKKVAETAEQRKGGLKADTNRLSSKAR